MEQERAILNHNTQISGGDSDEIPSAGSGGGRGAPIFSPRSSSQASKEEEEKKMNQVIEEAQIMREQSAPKNDLH